MRFLAALALLVLGVANAHHTPEHQLGYPKFVDKKTHLYDVTINVTSGVPGMHAQVAKSAMEMELKVYAKTPSEIILSIHKVRSSGALVGVPSASEYVEMKPRPELEEHLKVPFKAVLRNGMVESYTLGPKESLESMKIKKTILRNLEVYIDRRVLRSDSQSEWPVTYNLTRNSEVGNYSSHYIVTSSPNPAFPYEKNVFNISRTDNYEVIPYMAYESYSNFEQHGCPEVCKKNHIENRFGAGCPAEFEPHHTPMKRSFIQHHNLVTLKNNNMIIDMIRTKESHVADLYDQNMEVVIRTLIKFRMTTGDTINERPDQQTYTDLHDLSKEVNEREINDLCKYMEPKEAIESAKRLLEKISTIVLEGNVDKESSKLVGEELILLQKALTVLAEEDLKTIHRTIPRYELISESSELDKIKRQIWLDSLPVVGTDESIAFIVKLIEESMNKPKKDISIWEAKTILEALPENILEPSVKTIIELEKLLELIRDRQYPGYTIFFSATHLTVARVIRNMCINASNFYDEEDIPRENSPRSLHKLLKEKNMDFRSRRCPRPIVKKFIEDISEKLKQTNDKAKRIIYIETLARTGQRQALKTLELYVNGKLPASEVSDSYLDYIRTVTIHALHNVVNQHPREVQNLVLPIFFNKTEAPKIRTAAFGVFARSQPTLGDLQHVAEQTWTETSQEVASYVTSTLTTFGNSSIPCHQLTSRRIQKVLPQIKRFDGGRHHAKNVLRTMYDDFRAFGIEHRYELTPSNESFFPSTVYGGLAYNVDSLRDIFFQYAFTAQGLSSRNVWDVLQTFLKRTPAEDIPKQMENEIFRELNIDERDPEFWRFTIYEKLFYSASYYYLDGEQTEKGCIFNILKEHLANYFKRDSHGNWNGHLVKVYIPSSYRSKAIGHALPYPVEFEMRNPLLVSLKLQLDTPNTRSEIEYSLDITPSVYYSTLYSNQMLNLGDCKQVGVYHEKRVAVTYPFKLTLKMEQDGRFHFAYSFPQLPKKIFTYHSEAGTYAAKRSMKVMPQMENRKTIMTIPSQFVRKFKLGYLGMPPLVYDILSEDIELGNEEMASTPAEVVQHVIKRFLNAGWRRKSVEITWVADSQLWEQNSEVKVHFNYSREHVAPKEAKSEEDWSSGLNFEDKLHHEDSTVYVQEGQTIHKKLTKYLSYFKDELNVNVEQVSRGKSYISGGFSLVHNHTIDGFVHLVHVDANATIPFLPRPVDMTADYAIAFVNRPNEFKYGEQSYGKQKCLALGAISFNKNRPFYNPYVIGKALFSYKPVEHVLGPKMSPPLTREDFLPETHEECLRDVRNGKAQSVACQKAMSEWAIYNNLKVHAVWSKDLPSYVRYFGHKLDVALKHVFYDHLTHQPKPVSKGLYLEIDYIDKMTDEPVLNVTYKKPTELVNFESISAGWIQPISSIDTVVDTYAQAWSNNSYPATCALMDRYVNTYDMMTYEMPKDASPCSYVLSTHCTENKKFAVLAKYEPGHPGSKEITIHLGSNKIVLVPGSRSEYRVKYNDQERRIKALRPVMLNEEEMIYCHITLVADNSAFIEVHAEKAGIKISYDGKNVKVQVHPRYKGELCGLCSEFNGEIVTELRGPNSCLYSNAADFVKASMVGSCGDRTPSEPYICNGEYRSKMQRPDQEDRDIEGQEPSLKRNMVLSREDKLCFSTKPVSVCENNVSPAQTQSQDVDFHCLPKSDRNARKLVTESKRRILGELETKSVDMSESVEIARMC